MKRALQIIILVLAINQVRSQGIVERIEPPFWWTGMKDTTLQLLVYGDGIAEFEVITDHKLVKISSVNRVENPNYLFLDILIPEKTRPGKLKFIFEYQREVRHVVHYELLEREEGSAERIGFGKEDVIYLLMPDRFSNGDPENDSVPGMLEKAERSNPNGRHGGDIEGIIRQADYLEDLGITAIWINPLLENNQPAYSYHGYAITDYYRIDPRFGTNEDYREMVEEFHHRGIKVIMDMVFNHCGDNHWWMRDMPMGSWIHRFDEYTRSNFRNETVMDPYASDFDKQRMISGWFDRHMPDLNQHNPVLARYLIQNSIWWIEYAGLDGIRMDTYPYSYRDFMAEWMKRIRNEYPDFNVVGETWLQRESHTGWWQDGSPVSGGFRSHLSTVTDFPMHFALKDAMNEAEGWTTGLARIYYVLSQDMVYDDPFKNVIFADNHDLSRFYTSIHEDFARYRMAMAILLTVRGIPSVYYGTEYIMTGEEHQGHGSIREDFPGGNWTEPAGGRQVGIPELSAVQLQAHDYLKTLLNWRKSNEVIHSGKLKQFVPQDGIYVYFRYNDSDAVMVISNKNVEPKDMALERFAEMLNEYSSGRDVTTQGIYELRNMIRVPAMTTLVLELE